MNYQGSTCICRVPKSQVRSGTVVECVHCGMLIPKVPVNPLCSNNYRLPWLQFWLVIQLKMFSPIWPSAFLWSWTCGHQVCLPGPVLFFPLSAREARRSPCSADQINGPDLGLRMYKLLWCDIFVQHFSFAITRLTVKGSMVRNLRLLDHEF